MALDPNSPDSKFQPHDNTKNVNNNQCDQYHVSEDTKKRWEVLHNSVFALNVNISFLFFSPYCIIFIETYYHTFFIKIA